MGHLCHFAAGLGLRTQGGVRRSSRSHHRPLEYWRNEKKVYTTRDHTSAPSPLVAAVLLPSQTAQRLCCVDMYSHCGLYSPQCVVGLLQSCMAFVCMEKREHYNMHRVFNTDAACAQACRPWTTMRSGRRRPCGRRPASGPSSGRRPRRSPAWPGAPSEGRAAGGSAQCRW